MRFLLMLFLLLIVMPSLAAEPADITDEEWKRLLSPEQYDVLRGCGTEPPFTGKFWNHKEAGIYRCAACKQELFSSKAKYDSKSGWPSFWTPTVKSNIKYKEDNSYGMKRTEAVCSRCGGHLGHIFEDGPPPTGLRYCINSAALDFVPDPKPKK